jgi:hypothetical protein
LRTFFAALYLISSSKRGISSLQLSRQLGITQKSAWFVLHRIREMLKEKGATKLENTVEVDETYIGGKIAKKHKKIRKTYGKQTHNRMFKKTAVVALLERNNKVRTHVWQEDESLKDMVVRNVNFTATVCTDAARAYLGLDQKYAAHEVVNHSNDEYVRGSFHTNTVEGFFGILKRGIYGIYHQVSPKHLQR